MPVPAPPYLDDHECQLALQQEEEALADAVGGVPGLGSGRGGGWPCSGPAADMLQPDVADVHASERPGQTKPPGRAARGGEAPPRAQEGPARNSPPPAGSDLCPGACLSPTCSMSRMMLMVSSWRKVSEQGRLLSCPESCSGERPSEAWAMLVLVA